MKLVINVPDYIKEQADDGKGEEFGIPLWLAYEIANGTPLPKGHGRLIDAGKYVDVLNNAQIEGLNTYEGLGRAKELLIETHAIIEADNGDGNTWYDIPADEMSESQLRVAVKELRKKLAEVTNEIAVDDVCEMARALRNGTTLEKLRADVINIADGRQSIKVRSVLRIIDKHKAEREEI